MIRPSAKQLLKHKFFNQRGDESDIKTYLLSRIPQNYKGAFGRQQTRQNTYSGTDSSTSGYSMDHPSIKGAHQARRNTVLSVKALGIDVHDRIPSKAQRGGYNYVEMSLTYRAPLMHGLSYLDVPTERQQNHKLTRVPSDYELTAEKVKEASHMRNKPQSAIKESASHPSHLFEEHEERSTNNPVTSKEAVKLPSHASTQLPANSPSVEGLSVIKDPELKIHHPHSKHDYGGALDHMSHLSLTHEGSRLAPHDISLLRGDDFKHHNRHRNSLEYTDVRQISQFHSLRRPSQVSIHSLERLERHGTDSVTHMDAVNNVSVRPNPGHSLVTTKTSFMDGEASIIMNSHIPRYGAGSRVVSQTFKAPGDDDFLAEASHSETSIVSVSNDINFLRSPSIPSQLSRIHGRTLNIDIPNSSHHPEGSEPGQQPTQSPSLRVRNYESVDPNPNVRLETFKVDHTPGPGRCHSRRRASIAASVSEVGRQEE